MASLTYRAMVAALSIVACSSAMGSCLAYEPAEVTLVGKVSIRTFAGPPNYESVASGDRPVRVALLELKAPICMRSKTSDLINVARDDVRVVQLVLMPGPMVSIKDGQAISVTGTLFGSHTGHHRTPVLIQVQAVKDAIQQPVVDRRLQLASLGRRRGKTGTLDGRKAEGRR